MRMHKSPILQLKLMEKSCEKLQNELATLKAGIEDMRAEKEAIDKELLQCRRVREEAALLQRMVG